MSEREPDPHDEPERGSIAPAPSTPTEDKAEPEAGTGSADKRSPESEAEQDTPGGDAGEAGGDITR